jgi:glycosyltransferase involved in cell wall biosynthesis
VPVVASRLGALAGTVRDDETGLLAQPGDVDDFAEKIGRIWHDPELARRLGRGAAAHVATNYGPRAHVERMLRVYRELCPRAA